jgi:predicted RecA/RadA family phage recombinase
MKDFLGDGLTVLVVAEGDVKSGDVYQKDQKIGVYTRDADDGTLVEIWVRGEFLLPFAGVSGGAVDPVDWNGSGIGGAVGQSKAAHVRVWIG